MVPGRYRVGRERRRGDGHSQAHDCLLYWSAGTVLMHALDVLGDPVRRRILELLAEGEQNSGAIVAAVQRQFSISQPAVSQHLRVLREAGLARVRSEGPRRFYAVETAPLQQ